MLSQRRFSGRWNAPSRTSAQPAALAYDAPRDVELLADPLTGGAVGDPFLERARPASLDPLRHLDDEPRARPLGWIRVERDVEPLGPRVVDEPEQHLGTGRMRRPMVEVGDVGGCPGAPADLDRFAERVEEAVAERVPDVAVVEPAGTTRLRGQRGEFRGRRERPRRIVEPGAEPERAVGHRVAQDAAHPVDRGLVDGDVVPAERRDPELRVADERRDVDADRAVVALEVARHRRPVVVDRRSPVEAGVEVDERLEILASG